MNPYLMQLLSQIMGGGQQGGNQSGWGGWGQQSQQSPWGGGGGQQRYGGGGNGYSPWGGSYYQQQQQQPQANYSQPQQPSQGFGGQPQGFTEDGQPGFTSQGFNQSQQQQGFGDPWAAAARNQTSMARQSQDQAPEQPASTPTFSNAATAAQQPNFSQSQPAQSQSQPSYRGNMMRRMNSY